MKPGTRVRLVAPPNDVSWPDEAIPLISVSDRVGWLGTVIPGTDYTTDACVHVVLDSGAVSANHEDDGFTDVSGVVVPLEAVKVIEASHDAPTVILDPWRLGAHDEERLAVGGQQQAAWSHSCPSAWPPDQGMKPAPGAAGAWRLVLAASHVGGTVSCWWVRWLVPVQP